MIFCPSLRNKCVPEHLRNQRSLSFVFFCVYFSHIMPAIKFKISRHHFSLLDLFCIMICPNATGLSLLQTRKASAFVAFKRINRSFTAEACKKNWIMIFKLINFEGIKNNPETCTSILCFYHNRRPVPYQVQILSHFVLKLKQDKGFLFWKPLSWELDVSVHKRTLAYLGRCLFRWIYYSTCDFYKHTGMIP